MKPSILGPSSLRERAATGRWSGPLAAALLGVWLLAGCDRQKINELEEGVATVDDVRARFGEPAVVYDDGGGARTFEYPRQPEGSVNYMISIGADGRMTALRQVLQPSTFARVTPGLETAQVRRLLGRPAKMQRFSLKQQEVWDWRFSDGNQTKLFSVTFDRDGRVVASATTLDVEQAGQGGK
jgi:outer membrane protein assembly factor BamE (lipoprotein component of BamABCDE complex)